MKDLTKGKPSTLILAFALPIFFANLLQLTYSLVDTRIVGTFLGEDALAAVGATTTLSNLIIGFLQGLSGGFAIIIAQKFGAKDYKNCHEPAPGNPHWSFSPARRLLPYCPLFSVLRLTGRAASGFLFSNVQFPCGLRPLPSGPGMNRSNNPAPGRACLP